MALYCIFSEKKRDICQKSRFFSYPLAFDGPVSGGGFLSEYCRYGKTKIVELPDGEKNFEDMCNHVDTIPACDGEADGQTDGRTDILRLHSLRYAYTSRGKNSVTLDFITS